MGQLNLSLTCLPESAMMSVTMDATGCLQGGGSKSETGPRNSLATKMGRNEVWLSDQQFRPTKVGMMTMQMHSETMLENQFCF